MTEQKFPRLTDRTRLDRLQGEILAFVSGFEGQGYDNLEIARELLGAAFERAGREPRQYITESFYQHVCQRTTQLLADMEGLTREMAAEYEKQKIN